MCEVLVILFDVYINIFDYAFTTSFVDRKKSES